MRRLACSAVLCLIACWGAAPSFAQGPAGIEYDLRFGSTITDGCKDCDRIPIVRDLEGTMRIEWLPAGPFISSGAITEIRFQDPAGDYMIEGSGPFTLRSDTDPPAQEMQLKLTVNGVKGVDLASTSGEVSVPMPAIEIEVTEPGDRDPAHLYTIRIVTAPVVPLIRYDLVKGSTFLDDCEICGRVSRPVPIVGSFLLGEIDGGANPVSTFRLDGLDALTVDSSGVAEQVRIVGAGTYQNGGEVAVRQSLRLRASVNDVPAGILSNLDPGVIVVFPEIDVEVKQERPDSPTHVYSLHLIAKPAKAEPQFRRGDVNADDKVDISDGIGELNWLFLGGQAPPCLDSADVNDDGAHDLSDAVFVLLFLFQGGSAPPAPGPAVCGPSPSQRFGCESFLPCGTGD